MTPIKTTKGDWLAVDVPKGAYDFQLYHPPHVRLPMLDYFKFQTTAVGEVHLPPGTYTILGIARELTEAQWAEVVEDSDTHAKVWMDYTGRTPFCWTTVASGLSLLSAHGISHDCLILKRH